MFGFGPPGSVTRFIDVAVAAAVVKITSGGGDGACGLA